jgi:hypothetical protein
MDAMKSIVLFLILVNVVTSSCTLGRMPKLDTNINWYLIQEERNDGKLILLRQNSKGFKFTSPFNYGVRFESDTTLFFFRMQYPSGDSPCMERMTCSYMINSDTLFFRCTEKKYEMKLNKKGTSLIGANSILNLFPCKY